MARDPKSLKKYKEMFPSFTSVPDEEFHYIDGKWYISLNGMKQIAFMYKRPDLLKIAKEAETNASTNKNV